MYADVLPYQRAFVEAVREQLAVERGCVVIRVPTGAGKCTGGRKGTWPWGVHSLDPAVAPTLMKPRTHDGD